MQPGLRWYVTEKIHGSNFSVIAYRASVGDVRVTFCRRSAPLPSPESPEYGYFNIRALIPQLEKSAIALLNATNGSSVQVYGELYGDAVQKQIKYDKHNQFKVFDVRINDTYMPYAKMGVVEACGFELVPVIGIDSLENIIAKYGPPGKPVQSFTSQFSVCGDIAEGCVAKCIHEGKLFAVKIKSAEFDERHRGGIPKIVVVADPSSSIDPALFWNYLINEPRLAGLLSKHGPVTEKSNLNMLSRELITDAAQSFAGDNDMDEKIVKAAMFKYRTDALEFIKQYNA
jgi:Rnl2 family RNA ligase